MKNLRLLFLLAGAVLWTLLAPPNLVLRYVSLITVMSAAYTISFVGLSQTIAVQESKRRG